MKDYYLILGISKGSDIRKIKNAYRILAKKYHPDLTPQTDHSDRFRQAKEAYEILSDEFKRKQYDDELEKERTASNRNNNSRSKIIESPRSFMDEIQSVDAFFDGFVPTLMTLQPKTRKDLYVEIILTPHEASHGGLFPLTVPLLKVCSSCGRSGFRGRINCPVCNGEGYINSRKEFSLSIPPGVSNQTDIKLPLDDIGLKHTYLNVLVLIDSSLNSDPW